MGSLDNRFGFDWGMDFENGFEGGGVDLQGRMHWMLGLYAGFV